MKKSLLSFSRIKAGGEALFLVLLSSVSFAQENKITGIPGACGTPSPFLKTAAIDVPLDGSGFLGQVYNDTKCGLNFVAGTVLIEQRSAPWGINVGGTGLPTSINISGLAPCTAVDRAFLYFVASYQSGPPLSPGVSLTNPQAGTTAYTAGIIGSSGDKCWGEAGTSAYRADVTSNITTNGAYGLNISGFGNPNWEIDGALLLIFYRDLSATYQGTVILDDGAMTCGAFNGYANPQNHTMTGFSACGTSTSANAFLLVTDMQDNINGGAHGATVNGASGSYPNTFFCFDQAATNVFAGQNSSAFSTNGYGQDCYMMVLNGLYYQTTSCVMCAPSALANTTSATAETCGNSNGTASVNVTGGIPPYNYSWSPAVAGNVSSASGLPAGTYQITINDVSGCSTVVTIVVPGTPGPSVTASSTATGCTVNNGTASASPSGGTPGYTYSWSPSGGTGPTENNLAAGTYVVTVTDANGCATSTSIVVSTASAPTVSATSTQTGCTVVNGSATATPSGGTPGYTYLWSNGDVNQTANNLGAGTYTVIVTDANGCSSFTTVTVSTINGPSTTSSVLSNVDCNGNSTGSATTTPSLGTPGYTYSWSPIGGNGQTANNLPAGTYTVIVTDANGCTIPDVVTITEPAAIVLTTSQTNLLCSGGTNGDATVTPTGGTPGYTYLWNTVPVQNTQTANNLSAGTYQCTVTDANGCSQIISVTIIQPFPLSASSSSISPLCNGGNNGSATATVTNGTPNYTYVWNTTPPQNSQTATGLSAGTYSVSITDANGCTTQSSVNVTDPPALTLTASGADSICFGDSIALTANATGGTPSYTYVWIPGPVSGSTITVNPTSSTNYTVSVVDANGCMTSSVATAQVAVVPSPTAGFDTVSANTSYYAFTDSSTGATGWIWYFGDGDSSFAQNPIHNFPGAGTYTVTQIVFNQYGCPDTITAVITIGEDILIPNVFTPDADGTNDVFYIPNSGMRSFHIEIFDRWGLKVFETAADEIRWDGRSMSGKLLVDGTYYFVLDARMRTSSNGERSIKRNGFVTLLTKTKK